ncbi:MAG: phosphoribosylanthranilate isomerase [Planctomycetaceae bacterium]
MTGVGPLFHVKVCGVTTPADAALAAAAGADAIGLNFVAGSPRRIDVATARAVADAVPAGVLVVGVFAGVPATEVVATARAARLGAVQLHGHLVGEGAGVDSPEACAEVRAALGSLPLIRAVRLGTDGLAEARRWLAAATAVGATPDFLIVDAAAAAGVSAGSLGGTGARVDWRALAAAGPLGLGWALAGGLDPRNVAEAIRVSGAEAVDVASGVESAPGRKDPEMVRAFVAAARAALPGGPVRPPEARYYGASRA